MPKTKQRISDLARAASEAFGRLTVNLRTVGATPEKQLDWLMRFLDADLSDRHARAAAAGQVHAFCMLRFPAWRGSLADVNPPVEEEIESPDAPDDLPHIQRAVKACMAELRDRDFCRFPTAVGNGLMWGRSEAVSVVHTGGGLGRFLGAVADRLVELGPRLRCCESPGCGRFFAAKRETQRYCSARCGNRVHVARYAEAHRREISNRRHARHQQSLPKGAKAQRRTARPRRRNTV